MVGELESLGPVRVTSGTGMGHPGVIIPVEITVTPYFTPDCGPVAPDPVTDFGVAETGVEAPHDGDPLIQTESMSLTAGQRHVPGIGDPAAATPD